MIYIQNILFKLFITLLSTEKPALKRMQNEHLLKQQSNREIWHTKTNHHYHAKVLRFLSLFVISIISHVTHASMMTTIANKLATWRVLLYIRSLLSITYTSSRSKAFTQITSLSLILQFLYE